MNKLTVFALLAVSASAATEVLGQQAPPLFESNELIEFTLRADFDQIKGDRSQDPEERDALIDWFENGEERSMGMKLQTRGKFRLQSSTCSFPPLQLDFKKDSLSGTLWDGQNKLKLVTFCRDRDNYERNVMEEYLVYRGYNLLTDYSFRVRPASITYVDTSGDDDPVTRFGFIIEDEEALAERLGGTYLEVEQAHPRHLSDEDAAVMSLYQYMIANTDWSSVYFHNMKLIRNDSGAYVPIPYDFDFAGMVDAPYASPDPSLTIRSVRERLYRGFCRQIDLGPLIERFREHKAPFEAEIRATPGLEEGDADDIIGFIGGFYDLLDNPERAINRFQRECRSMPRTA